MKNKIRCGIVGTGKMAEYMSTLLLFEPDIEVCCVSSRTMKKAEAFAKSHFITGYVDDYKNLIHFAPDFVYVSSLPDSHYEISRFFLEKGVAVLCEKPLTFSIKEAEELVSIARNKHIPFFQNIVTAYLPIIKKTKEYVANSGMVEKVELSIGDRHEPDESRLFTDPSFGGVYCDLASYVFYFLDTICKEPPRINMCKSIYLSPSIDVETSMTLQTRQTNIDCQMSIKENTTGRAIIYCKKATVVLEHFGKGGDLIVYDKEGMVVYEEKTSYKLGGFEYVFNEITETIRQGRIESENLNFETMLLIVKQLVYGYSIVKELRHENIDD